LLGGSAWCRLQLCQQQPEFSNISDDELLHASLSADVANNQQSRFKDLVSADELASIDNKKFAKNTVDQSTRAETLFGKWQADRNIRIFSLINSIVYINEPFGAMADNELNYSTVADPGLF
jgi:hypothetical protein